MEPSGLRETIDNTITDLGGGDELDKIAAPFTGTIDNICKAYADLSLISRYRNTYNNSWALSFAFSQMQELIDHLFTVQVTEKIETYSRSFRNRKQRTDIMRKFHRITGNLTDLIRKTSTSQRLFKTTIWLVSLAEGAISLFIVLLISETAAAFNRAVSLPQFSLLFLTVFGSVRLLLESLKNRVINNWRWRRYQDTVDNAFHHIARATGLSCILAYHVKQGSFLNEIDDLLERGIEILQQPLSTAEQRRRRASHKSARMLAEQREKLAAMQTPHAEQFQGIRIISPVRRQDEEKQLPVMKERIGNLLKKARYRFDGKFRNDRQ